jgi:hypothetical protein
MQEELGPIKSFMQAFSVPMLTGMHSLNTVGYVFEPLSNECNIHAYTLYSVVECISMYGF